MYDVCSALVYSEISFAFVLSLFYRLVVRDALAIRLSLMGKQK